MSSIPLRGHSLIHPRTKPNKVIKIIKTIIKIRNSVNVIGSLSIVCRISTPLSSIILKPLSLNVNST